MWLLHQQNRLQLGAASSTSENRTSVVDAALAAAELISTSKTRFSVVEAALPAAEPISTTENQFSAMDIGSVADLIILVTTQLTFVYWNLLLAWLTHNYLYLLRNSAELAGSVIYLIYYISAVHECERIGTTSRREKSRW
jgi:hypothetical protein